MSVILTKRFGPIWGPVGGGGVKTVSNKDSSLVAYGNAKSSYWSKQNSKFVLEATNHR